MPPFEIAGIDHLLVLVEGMGRALAFYEGVLGCEVDERLPEYAMVVLRAGASKIDLADIADERGAWARPEVYGGRNVDHFCLALRTSDEAALRAHLAAHRVTIVEEQLSAEAGGDRLSLYIRDPDGNVVELKGPHQPQPR